jgi:hypothetical protein
VPAGPGVERQVGQIRFVGGAQPAAGQVRHPTPGADRGGHRTGEHHRGAVADVPPCLGERVQASGLVTDEYATRSAQPVPDRDLAGVHGVEPGERLVGADVLAAPTPQVLQLALAELEPAGAAGCDHTGVEVGQVVRPHSGVGQRPVGRDQGVLGHPVGLREQPVR